MTGARARDERGSALILVMGSMSVLLLLVGVTLNGAMNVQRVATRSLDWNQAAAAAEAGVDDYLARLNRDDLYWNKVDCSNPAMKRPMTGSPLPCGWGPSTAIGWLTVPSSEATSEFHYDVDASETPVDGTIDLTVTGRSGDTTRSIQVVLRRGGFGEFLYYTVYETVDPADELTYGFDNQNAVRECTHYFWEPLTSTSRPRNSGCEDINFVTGDVLDGPVHSNDAILVSGRPRFTGTVTTSWPQCRSTDGSSVAADKCFRHPGNDDYPVFDRGISYRSEIDLPTSIGDLRQHVDPARTTTPGCLYTGPTRIRFLPPSGTSPAQMRVWSKWSTYNGNANWPGTSQPANPGCGTATALKSTNGATVDVPTGRLIMIQDVPANQSQPVSGACAADSIVNVNPSGTANDDRIPLANDTNRTLREADCRYGTVYVEGTLRGRITVAADNNIVITGNLVYAGGTNGTDALGLIAENSVKIYHPIELYCAATNRDGQCVSYARRNLRRANDTFFINPVVNASILTLRHSFAVQAYGYGSSLGTLTLHGSLAQRFRGAVGRGSGSSMNGYLKDYSYDTRLRYSPPPFFLDPVRSGWGRKTYGEVTARY